MIMTKIMTILIICLIILFFTFFISYLFDHQKATKKPHNCNIDCVLYSPWNILYKNISLIKDKPVYTFEELVEHLPELEILQKNWLKIRDEYYQIVENKTKPIKGEQFFEEDIIHNDKWTRYYIKWYSDISNQTKKETPFTSNLIEQCPNIQLAMFSVLKPNSNIKPHRGPYRGSLRLHLALDTPKDDKCFIMVDGKKYRWNNGDFFIMDDTYIHEVVNNSKKDRVVLFLDISRPVKYPFIQKITHKIASLTHREN